jgi:hypothetical protein
MIAELKISVLACILFERSHDYFLFYRPSDEDGSHKIIPPYVRQRGGGSDSLGAPRTISRIAIKRRLEGNELTFNVPVPTFQPREGGGGVDAQTCKLSSRNPLRL